MLIKKTSPFSWFYLLPKIRSFQHILTNYLIFYCIQNVWQFKRSRKSSVWQLRPSHSSCRSVIEQTRRPLLWRLPSSSGKESQMRRAPARDPAMATAPWPSRTSWSFSAGATRASSTSCTSTTRVSFGGRHEIGTKNPIWRPVCYDFNQPHENTDLFVVCTQF